VMGEKKKNLLQTNRELKIHKSERLMHEGRCDERLKQSVIVTWGVLFSKGVG
jgi:hypothetical protein